MPYIANPNASPQQTWVSNDPLQACLTNSTTWANYLQNYLAAMAAVVTTPNFEASWGDISGGVPVVWGAAYSAPQIPGVATPADPTVSTSEFSFADESYTADIKEDAKTVLVGVLGGDPLIGQTAWDDIYTEAADDITAAFTAATLQAGNISGMLGELPGEALVLLTERAASEQRKALAKVRIGSATERAKAWREDVAKALDAGRAHDQLYGTLHQQEKSRALEAAKETADASYRRYGVEWQAVAQKQSAILAGTQAYALPTQLTIDSEKARFSIENQILQLAVENAKLEQGKGVAEANLHIEQLKYGATINADLLKSMASLSAHTMGAYLAAGSVHYSVSSSESYSNSNSYSMTKDETV